MSSITQVNLGTMTSPAAGSTINGPSLVKDLDPVITKIESTEEYMHYLQGFSASMLEQKQAGYIVQQLSITDLNKKIRCTGKIFNGHTVPTAQIPSIANFGSATFGKAVRGSVRGLSATRNRENVRSLTTPQKDRLILANAGAIPLLASDNEALSELGSKVSQIEIAEGAKMKPSDRAKDNVHCRCNYHSGIIQRKAWTCCGQHISQPGCKHEQYHLPKPFILKDMIKRFQCCNTPRIPECSSGPNLVHVAVALDCEMGTAYDNEVQIIRVTLIDYLTTKVLIDSLVWPDVAMAHLNTQYSGVTWQHLRQAKRDGVCIMGTRAARNEVFKYIGPDTVVVGHGASSDLSALNWIHPAIVDSLIIESAFQKTQKKQEEAEREAEKAERQWFEDGPGPSAYVETPGENEKEEKKKQSSQRGKLTLKTLSRERLRRQIQMGRRGHDSLEDALAARDIVHWHVLRLIKTGSPQASTE
ncbi:hypothetical protein ACHAO3_009226 [Verticillium nonalfalfae]|uniref:Exonuclease domain-containing protein n=1 Tax=Verticillium dahliae TaxID=27337 RepID=A0AA44WSY6_VERDA|nr:hypothetical protein BJF96_g569 [Verticillium dahliae]